MGEISDCILWGGGKDKDGYGVYHEGNKNYRAHRIAWSRKNGPIPSGMLVLHTCDNPACVNTDHLFLGTQQDNVSDKVRKGRQARGEKQHSAKLTESDVREIRKMYGDFSYNQLARLFSVSKKAVLLVVKRVTWKHIV